MRTRILLLVCCFLADFSLANPVTIGAIPFNPPFEIRADDKGNMFGFDIDIMDNICRQLKIKCVYKPMTFEQLFNNLNDGKIDVAVGGITITQNRAKKYLFSLPYLLSYARFLSLRETPIHWLQDIKGKTVGVEQGTVFKEYANTLFYGKVKFKAYDNVELLIDALINKEVDVIFVDNPAAIYWLVQNSDKFKLIGKRLELGAGIGIMSVKANKALILKMNEAIRKLERDGTYQKIYKRYFPQRE